MEKFLLNARHALHCLVSGCDGGDLLDSDDGSVWGGSNEEFDIETDLGREWQRRRDQFHTVC